MRTLAGFWLGAMLALVGGCGGGAAAGPSDEPGASASEGGETASEPTEAEEEAALEEAPPPPRATGPGRLTVRVRVRGEDTAAGVEVLGADGSVAASGRSGETFSVPAGTYRIRAAISDAAVMIDTPTREHDDTVSVEPGAEASVAVEIPVARVRLNVQRGGRPATGWRATVTRQGPEANEPIVIEATADYIQITPGRYDAVLRVGGNEVTVNGLIFQGGATQTVPVNVN